MLAITALIYQPGLVDLWVFDDHPNLGPLVDDLNAGHPVGEIVSDRLFSGSGPTGRPVSMLTFIVDGATRGTSLGGWKSTNLLLHLFCGVLIFLVINQLQRHFELAADDHAIPLLVSALWLLHPLHASTVLYTVQRMALLSALFQLAGLYGYLRARASYRAGDTPASLGWLCIVVLALLLGTFSKESGFLLVTYVILVELIKPAGGAREVRWRTGTLAIALVVMVAAVSAVSMLRPGMFTDGYVTRSFSLEERLMTQPRVLFDYARLTVIPNLADMKFIHDDFVISHGLFDPKTTLLALAGLLSLALLAVYLRRTRPLVSFGIGLFICGHLVESSFIPLDLMYEHRQYFPSIGLLLALAALSKPLIARHRLAIVALIPLLGLLSGMTWARAVIWSSEQNLYTEMVRINPDSPRAMTMVANWLGGRGEIDAARTVLARIGTPAAKLNGLYYDCVESGALSAEDLETLSEPEIVGFHAMSGLMYLGRAGLSGSCRFPDAAYLDLLDRWMERPLHGPRGGLLIYRGYYLARQGRSEESAATLEKAASATGGGPVALVIAAELSIDAGHLVRARRLLEMAREVVRDGPVMRDIELAYGRLRLAQENPEKLLPFDPFGE